MNPTTDVATYSMLSKFIPPVVRLHGALAIQVTAPYLAVNPPLLLGQVQVNTIKYWADRSTQGFMGAIKQA